MTAPWQPPSDIWEVNQSLQSCGDPDEVLRVQGTAADAGPAGGGE